jgi:hypothetical protein
MRIKMSINAAGDMRLQCLRDVKRKPVVLVPDAATLVCNSKLQEMTTDNERREKTGHGRLSTGTAFGRNARTIIREAGSIVDRLPPSMSVFLTGTLPGSTDAALRAFAEWSSWIVQTTQQWARDIDESARMFGVWEYQRRGALHIHVCIQSSSCGVVNALLQKWHERWCDILRGVRRRSGVDIFARNSDESWEYKPEAWRTDAQKVEKSVGNYLSKYLSKGSLSNQRRANYPPARWWFCSMKLRKEVKDNRRTVELTRLKLADALEAFEVLGGHIAGMTSKAFGYLHPYDVTVKGLVALLKPIEASLLFDWLSGSIRCNGLNVNPMFVMRHVTESYGIEYILSTA